MKIHWVIAASGHPVECVLTPGSDSDKKVRKPFALDLPEGSILTGDQAYNDYAYEDLLNAVGLSLIPLRKENSKRPLEPALTFLMARARKVVETTGRLIERLLPKQIHSVTATGFELKIGCFVIACTLGFITA